MAPSTAVQSVKNLLRQHTIHPARQSLSAGRLLCHFHEPIFTQPEPIPCTPADEIPGAPAESRPGRNQGIGDMINGSNGVLTVPTTTIPLTSRSFLSRPSSRLPPAPTMWHHLHVPLQGVVLYTAYRSGRSAWPDTCSIGESLHTPGLRSHDSNMFIVQARPHVRLYRAGKPNKLCLDPGPESAAIALEDWTAPAPHSLISSTRLHMIAASSGVIPNSPRRGMCRG